MRGEVTPDATKIRSGVRKHYNHTPTHGAAWTNVSRIKSWEHTTFPTQEEAEYLNRPITTNEIEAVIKNAQETKVPNRMASQVNFTKHSKKS